MVFERVCPKNITLLNSHKLKTPAYALSFLTNAALLPADFIIINQATSLVGNPLQVLGRRQHVFSRDALLEDEERSSETAVARGGGALSALFFVVFRLKRQLCAGTGA